MEVRTISRPATLADRLSAPFQRFLAIQAASTILLLFATIVALTWANSPWGGSYAHLWHTKLGLSLADWKIALSLEHWVNDGLMVLFFFLVGMEIKHELVHGELSSRDRAMLPAFGALGGMVVPAGIYASLHAGGPAASGWGVPMATDIAFAVAALAIFGPRVPPGLKVFLLALAIVDDLGAVLVIAVFYTYDLSLGALAAAGGGLALAFAMRHAGVRAYGPYWAVGIGVWFATLQSGLHATVAGVMLGFLTPTTLLAPEGSLVGRGRRFFEEAVARMDATPELPDRDRKRVAQELRELSRESLSPLERLTGALHPWSAFVVLPVFALANAGVPIDLGALADPLALRVAIGVGLGLIVGKSLGITLFCWVAVRLGFAKLPTGVGWGAVFGAAILGGIGFTMALFITALAFEDPALAAASKVGVMVASVLATALGIFVLGRVLPRDARDPERAAEDGAAAVG
jgi:NhaA family Na+:H+ antiporter